jgi:hypothetical protein
MGRFEPNHSSLHFKRVFPKKFPRSTISTPPATRRALPIPPCMYNEY